jgi:8-oxo-dGTP pyrophosphatase MutT (NUDIX family)
VNYVRELRALVGQRPLVLAVAGAIVIDADGRLLLHRRDDSGLWSTSGGAVEPGESLEDAARRELREETGLEAGRLRLLDVYSGAEFFVEYPNGDQVYVVGALFIAEDVRGEPMADGHESTQVGYFGFDALPDDVQPHTRLLIDRCRRLLDDAALGHQAF